MITLSHKATQFLVFLVKLLLVGAAFYFIYYKLTHDPNLNIGAFWQEIQRKSTIANVALMLFLSFLNRYLEIVKWQNLGSMVRLLSLRESAKQVLGALTAGLFTPNGVGEYAGKALYFEKSQAGRIVFLNLICNGIQMILSIVFGLIGLLYLQYFNFTLWSLGIGLAVVAVFWMLKGIRVKGYSLEALLHGIRAIPQRVHSKNMILALLRYLTFSHQYFILFRIFDVDLPYPTLMAAIAATYFLASSLPNFQFLDFAVKGSVGLFFFGELGISAQVVVFISTLMWILNLVLPVLLGSYFVMKFRPKWN